LVAAGFSLRLFVQLKSCGYRNLFAQVKTCGYFISRYFSKIDLPVLLVIVSLLKAGVAIWFLAIQLFMPYAKKQ